MRIAVDQRENILQAAARLFAHKPYHEVLMDEVAEKTGIAKGSIYRYFPNKQQLFSALSFRYMEKMAALVEESAKGDLSPLRRLHNMISRSAEAFIEHQDFFHVMQRHECELSAADLLERRNIIRDSYVRVIGEAVERKDLSVPFDHKFAADMLLGMVRNLLRFTEPRPKPDEIAKMVLHVFVSGLKKTKTGV